MFGKKIFSSSIKIVGIYFLHYVITFSCDFLIHRLQRLSNKDGSQEYMNALLHANFIHLLLRYWED